MEEGRLAMSRMAKVMVYSAMTEADVIRQYSLGAAEAESSGYVPISEAWDHNTLTVTYQFRGDSTSRGRQSAAGSAPERAGFWSRFSRRNGSR